MGEIENRHIDKNRKQDCLRRKRSDFDGRRDSEPAISRIDLGRRLGNLSEVRGEDGCNLIPEGDQELLKDRTAEMELCDLNGRTQAD